MSPNANVHSRTAGSKHPDRPSWLLILGAVLAGVVIASYLASFLFLWSFHLNPWKATPLTLIQYGVYYHQVKVVHQHIVWCSVGSLLLITAIPVALAWPKPRALHGDADFATRQEIARAGLLGQDGLILGQLGRRILTLPGQQSVILAAPPRSGKDVGVCIPNGLNWPGSLVVTDIKRENWAVTAGYRSQCGQACYRFEPLEAAGDTAHWNCLSYISPIPGRRINDLQRIADILYQETPGTDPFWVASAKSLFVGIGLYVLETPSAPKTMGEIRRQGMATDEEGFGEHWRRIVRGRQKGPHPLSAECVRALYDVIDLAPVTASSVRKTFVSRLDLWANPLLDAATADDDFDLRELRKKPISIYVCVNPDDLHRLRPILSLFFQQLLGLQTQELPEHTPDCIHQVLLLLNEFTALGRIPIVSEAMPYMPGYDVRILLVIQAPSQLREVYGQHNAETMMKSVAARIVFAPKDYADARDISDELGMTTVQVPSKSRPQFFSFNRHRSRDTTTTLSYQQRALMLPQEVKEIGIERALIFYENLRPVRCEKIRYYADRRFQSRLLPPPQTAVPRGRRRPGNGAAAENVITAVASGAIVETMPAPSSKPTVESALAELDQLDELRLEDFGQRLLNLEFKHQGDRPTPAEIDADVQAFLGALR
jgi:type IV secretion system protein VirD4